MKDTIWLVDASTYQRTLPAELSASKTEFFQLEAIARSRRIGPSIKRGSCSFANGLLQLAGLLDEARYDIHFLDLEGAERRLESSARGPICVGFSAVTPTVDACARFAALVKRRFPRTRTVLGGPHATAAPRLTQSRYRAFDQVVATRGAAAAAALGVVNEDAYRHRVDLLPLPPSSYGWNLLTYEGCPFSCSYCHDATILRRELQTDGGLPALVPMLGAGAHVHFCDSVLGGTAKRALAVCRRLGELHHPFSLSCDLRAEYLSVELIKALVSAGFVELRIGLDSGDPNVLARTRRTCLPSEVVRSLERVRSESDLYVSVYLVTGLPGSTLSSGEANRHAATELLSRRLADQIKHHLYVPYPVDSPSAAHPDVTLISDDWSRFDRNSYPVYELRPMAAPEIWRDFLETEHSINAAWRSALGLEAVDLSGQRMHEDYNVRVYLQGNGNTTSSDVEPFASIDLGRCEDQEPAPVTV
jgi:radical SAM superfamily enzyme YgiQ (UPF0313 family)